MNNGVVSPWHMIFIRNASMQWSTCMRAPTSLSSTLFGVSTMSSWRRYQSRQVYCRSIFYREATLVSMCKTVESA